DVCNLIEPLIVEMFAVRGIEVPRPFPRMLYKDAMDRYGSDKPDTRFGMEFVDLSDMLIGTAFAPFAQTLEKGGRIKAVVLKGGAKYSRKQIDELTAFVKDVYGASGLAWIRLAESGELTSSLLKNLGEETLHRLAERASGASGDMIFIIAGQPDTVAAALGALRLELGKREGLIDAAKWNFLWVTDFPMFEYHLEDKRWYAMHHPFTSPRDEDLEKLKGDDPRPGEVYGKAYDLVLNAMELGDGALRIHRSDPQQHHSPLPVVSARH